MKKILFTALTMLFITSAAIAQKPTDKVVLTKGQKIKMNTATNSDLTRGQQGSMKSDLKIMTEMVVTDVTDKGYNVEATMKTAKMNFEGFGMNMEYDSEDPEKKKGQMAKGFEQVLDKTEKIELDFAGKVIQKEEKEDGGMMRMMMGGADAASTVEAAFLIIPKDTKVDGKWRTTDEKDGLKIITEYTYLGIKDGKAALTANQQTKGEVAGGRAGAFTTKVNQLTQMKLFVDAKTGLVTMKDITTKDKSTTEMGGENIESSGTITTMVTCE